MIKISILFSFCSAFTSLHPIPTWRETLPYNATFEGLGNGVGIIDITGHPDVIQFYGIPYAEPPVGDRRFRVPKMVDKWEEELDLQKYKQFCPQIMFRDRLDITDENQGASEDCLYLSIFVPKAAMEDKTNSYSVNVYFHGGAYMFGK
jgi:para-nitrobenzyl esterase